MAADKSHNDSTKWYQRQLIVNPQVQYVFVYYAFALGFVLFAFGSVSATFLQRLLTLSATGWDPVTSFDILIVGTFFVIFMAGCYLGFVVSNHVVGPIFRLVQEFAKLERGEKMQPIEFRKKDHFHELAAGYNKMLERLNKAEAATKDDTA